MNTKTIINVSEQERVLRILKREITSAREALTVAMRSLPLFTEGLTDDELAARLETALHKIHWTTDDLIESFGGMSLEIPLDMVGRSLIIKHGPVMLGEQQ